jgi:hypothetical protein
MLAYKIGEFCFFIIIHVTLNLTTNHGWYWKMYGVVLLLQLPSVEICVKHLHIHNIDIPNLTRQQLHILHEEQKASLVRTRPKTGEIKDMN